MRIRNFPHQVNTIAKLRGALQVAAEILERGEDLSDDGIYGYTLIRREIQRFGDLPSPTPTELEERIEREQAKTESNQAPRTFARDLRRTLLFLGFLTKRGLGVLQLSGTGSRILGLPPLPHPETQALWIDAILGIALPGEPRGAFLHPARNMLRIVQSIPNVEKRWLAFALSMNNDSGDDLDRMLELIRGGDFDEARQAAGASEYQAANAVKILPALLEQVSLISITSARCNLEDLGRHVLSQHRFVTPSPVTPASVAPGRRRRRTTRYGYTVTSTEQIRIPEQGETTARTEEEQADTARLIRDGTAEHQRTVRTLVSLLQNVGETQCSEDAFDVLASSSIDDVLLLFEVKTLRNDGLARARDAVGQLLFYEFFDVLPRANQSTVLKVAVFNDEPGEDARAFLSYAGVLCVALLNTSVSVPEELHPYFSSQFFYE